MAEITTTWRDYRTCSPKQRLALDFLTRQGYFKNDEHRTRNLLYGGAGWGGKSHLLRTASYEILDVLRGLGFPNMWLTLYTNTYPNLADRHIRKYQDELADAAPCSGLVELPCSRALLSIGVRARPWPVAPGADCGVPFVQISAAVTDLENLRHLTRSDPRHFVAGRVRRAGRLHAALSHSIRRSSARRSSQ